MNAQMKCLRQKLASISQIRYATYSTLACVRQNILYPEDTAEVINDSIPDLALSHVDRNILAWKERCLSVYQSDKSISGLPSTAEERSCTNLHLNAVNPDLFEILKKNIQLCGKFDASPVAGKEPLLQSVSLCDLSMNGTQSKLNLGSVEYDSNVCNTSILKSVTEKPHDDHGIFKSESGGTGHADKGGEGRDGPTQLHLDTVREYYEQIIPTFHQKGENFVAQIHHTNIVFENNYFKNPKVVSGVKNYAKEIVKIRFFASLLYTSIRFEPVSITTNLSECCVKLHWRARVVSNWRFVTYWMPSALKGNRSDAYDVLEGISTFTVNKDGKIIKHQLDRTVPLSEKEVNPAAAKLAVKTASLIGLAPKTNFWSWFSNRRQ